MNLNPELVRARFEEIGQSLARLERFKGLSRQEFLANEDALDIACYRLLVAIEAALAICYHVCAKRLKKVPEEYAECFAALEEGGIIPADLSENLQKMARFRNMLVHVYWRIDYGRVYDILQHNLGDLNRFEEAIGKLL